MRIRLTHAILIAALLLTPATSNAARKPTGIGTEFPTLMRGVRMLGMGNAFITMPGSDSFAQFYNPAAINDFEDRRQYSMSFPGANFDPGFFEIVGELLDLKNELHSAHNSKEKIDYFDAFSRRNTGDYHSFEMAMPLFHVRHKRYAAGFIVDDRTVISLRNQAFPNFEFKTQTTAGIIGGSALGFFGDSLQVGGNLKILFSMGIEDQITSSDILVSSIKQLIGFNSWQKGVGVGGDFGMKYKLPLLASTLKPTLAVTVQDIADTRFTGGVEKLPMSVSIGAGVFPEIGGNFFAFLVDIRELNRKSNFMKKFHAGMEAHLPEVAKTRFSIRGGCNQGYPAFGISAAWKPVTLHITFYGEEAGNYTSSKGTYRLGAQLDIKI